MNKKLLSLILVGLCYANLTIADQRYDKTSIVPQTWEEIDLAYINTISGKDYIEQANFLRPISWIKQHHLDKVGATVHLTTKEIGADVDAKVVAIKPASFSYASISPATNNKPVIATFIRHSDDVWDYTFKDHEGTTEKIEATSNHPFYSLDRHDYIPIGQIKIGEHLKADNGKDIVLASRVKHNKGVEIVYNFEVYQAHNYAAGDNGLLVHNGPCFSSPLDRSSRLIQSRTYFFDLDETVWTEKPHLRRLYSGYNPPLGEVNTEVNRLISAIKATGKTDNIYILTAGTWPPERIKSYFQEKFGLSLSENRIINADVERLKRLGYSGKVTTGNKGDFLYNNFVRSSGKNRVQLKPQKIVLIDDHLKNMENINKNGMIGYHSLPDNSLEIFGFPDVVIPELN